MTQEFIPWFSLPQKLGYIHVDEDATKVMESPSTRFFSNSSPRYLVTKGNTNVPILNHNDWEPLGNL
jgi:hypothetical protein